mmetsp:Transcript_33110/g.59283  ORF Transcript_33110/g.59283 Transcript_33110/m.59283 type:complete len:126 (-) Transcript_33110:409-786(-)
MPVKAAKTPLPPPPPHDPNKQTILLPVSFPCFQPLCMPCTMQLKHAECMPCTTQLKHAELFSGSRLLSVKCVHMACVGNIVSGHACLFACSSMFESWSPVFQVHFVLVHLGIEPIFTPAIIHITC